MHKSSSHFSGPAGAAVCVRALALPLLLSDGTAALTMVSPLPFPPGGGGGGSEWFVVGEDWWTAIATPFLCEINSTCRSALYEWWRPPQVIHTAAQRHGSGPHRTYMAGIKQSLFPTGPCITDPRPHANTPTWIHRWWLKAAWSKPCSVSFKALQCSGGFSGERQIFTAASTVSSLSDTILDGRKTGCTARRSDWMELSDGSQWTSEGWIALCIEQHS